MAAVRAKPAVPSRRRWPCALLGLLMAVFGRASTGQTPPLRAPAAVVYDAAGNLFIADTDGNQVLESTLAGALVVAAGNGVQGFAGDGGSATAAELNAPQGLAFGADGTLYIADSGNRRIRAVTGGVISTFAGGGTAVGASGDGDLALAASLRQPTALAVDGTGALLVCDSADHRVRRISAGLITTVAGTGVQGFAGDGGPATAALLDTPAGIAVPSDGRILVSDSHNQRVRVIAADGTIRTFAGLATRGFGGDGGPALAASFSGPRGLAVAPGGVLLIADEDNERVRSVSSAGAIATVVGSGVEGGSVDGAAGASASMRAPRAVAVSSFGAVTVADTLNGTVRELLPANTLFEPAGLVPGRLTAVTVSTAGTASGGQTAPMTAPMTVTMTVTGAAGVPQGTVQWSLDGNVPVTATLSGGGTTLDLSSLPAGSHTLTVSYPGDGLNPATTAVIALGGPVALLATADPASAEYGAPVPMLTGELAGVLPGDVGAVEAVFTSAAGAAPNVGTYPITATLSGPRSAAYTVSMASGSGALRITQAASSIALAATGTAYVGMPLELTATVASTTTGQPTGQVQFLDGATVVATAPVSAGMAIGLYAAPPAGSRNPTAQYVGDRNFQPSTSAPEVATIAPMPDFAVSVSGSNAASVTAGGNATYNLNVTSLTGSFTGAVSFSVAGLPHGAAASFSPVYVVPGVNTAAVTVTVQTSATETAHNSPRDYRDRTRGRGVMTLACVSGVLLAKRKRRRMSLLLLGLGLLAGCGARTVDEGLQGVNSQSYALQVTGTGTNLAGAVVTHAVTLSLAVQQ